MELLSAYETFLEHFKDTTDDTVATIRGLLEVTGCRRCETDEDVDEDLDEFDLHRNKAVIKKVNRLFFRLVFARGYFYPGFQCAAEPEQMDAYTFDNGIAHSLHTALPSKSSLQSQQISCPQMVHLSTASASGCT